MRSIILFLSLSAGGLSYGNQTAVYMLYPAKGAMPERSKFKLKTGVAGIAEAEHVMPERLKFHLTAGEAADIAEAEHVMPERLKFILKAGGEAERLKFHPKFVEASLPEAERLKLKDYILPIYRYNDNNDREYFLTEDFDDWLGNGNLYEVDEQGIVKAQALYKKISSFVEEEAGKGLMLFVEPDVSTSNAKVTKEGVSQRLMFFGGPADEQGALPTQFLQALQMQTSDLLTAEEQEAIPYFQLSEPIGGGGGGGGALALFFQQKRKRIVAGSLEDSAYSLTDLQSRIESLSHIENPHSVLILPFQKLGVKELSGSWSGFSLGN